MTRKTTNSRRKRAASSQQQSGIEVVMNALLSALGKTGMWIVIALVVLLAAALGVAYYLFGTMTDASAAIEVDRRIGITPTQIESMKAIGQWEFLSVADEELIDTVRNGFFTDDELIRIYYGTLRLGFDMADVGEDWIVADGDTLSVTLPPIRLLDEKFIDEARTQSFFSSGKWSDQDRETMYQRARSRMKQRCLTPENVASAEQNASKQFYQLMRSMGFDRVRIRFGREN